MSKRPTKNRVARLVGVIVMTIAASGQAGIVAGALRCEYLANPLGIDVARPRLSWVVQATDPNERGQNQTAYRILVATSEEKVSDGQGDLWDSGKVASDESIHVAYAGKSLTSGMRCYWRVTLWDKDGRVGRDSETAWWELGLAEKEWAAKWITGTCRDGSLPYLRKAFSLAKPVYRARAYVTSLGYHKLYLNGRRIGDHVLDPAQSDFAKRVLYVTHDVTGQVVPGSNVMGVWLGKGWYWKGVHGVTTGKPAVLAELVVTHVDGTVEHIRTDGSWQTSPSPVTPFGEFPRGEIYDAGKEQIGWNALGFDDASWRAAEIVKAPDLTLSAQRVQPNRITETIRPASVMKSNPGEYVYDVGKNLTGWFRLNVFGKPGETIRLTYYAGHFGTDKPRENMRQADRYIIGPSGKGTLRSQHNYRAFRYVKVGGLSYEPAVDDAEAYLIQTDTAPTSTFECSSDLLNRLHQAVTYTHRCLTLGGVQVDCPHRERLGYGAEGQASLLQALYNFDTGAFYTKWVRDFQDGQDPQTGCVYYTAPYRIGSGGGPAWSGACIVMPWHVYLYYGDRRILSDGYESMRRWIGFLESKSKDGLLEYYTLRKPNIWEFLADWASPRRKTDTLPCSGHWPDRAENTFFNNCCYHMNLSLMTKIAAVLGRESDAARWSAKATALKEVINRKHFDIELGRYTSGEQQQTYLALPLLIDLVPAEHRKRVLQNLIDDIVVIRKGHLDTGVLGSCYLLKALTRAERSDLVYLMATQKTWPGWGYMMERGASTLWEHWIPGDSSIHNSFLSIGTWLIEGVGGIRVDERSPGFKRFIIKPGVVGDLTFAKTTYDSIRGHIASVWRIEDGRFHLSVTVPANTTATVYVPADSLDAITVDGEQAGRARGVRFVRMEEGNAIFELTSGRHVFVSGTGPD